MTNILALWRYPVKSMQGESLTEATIGPPGTVRVGDAITRG
jgi:uncharacterized protein YcbX